MRIPTLLFYTKHRSRAKLVELGDVAAILLHVAQRERKYVVCLTNESTWYPLDAFASFFAFFPLNWIFQEWQLAPGIIRYTKVYISLSWHIYTCVDVSVCVTFSA